MITMNLKALQTGALVLLISPFASVGAVVFTSDTAIGVSNSAYDGADVILSNCVVTIDGSHSFTSIRVANGGTLTHSASANGMIAIASPVEDEPQILTGTNAVTLANSNVITSSVLVKSSSGSATYTNLTDYVLSDAAGGFTALQRTESSSIPDGSLVLVSYSYASGATNAGLNLTLTADMTVDSGGAIDANGRGYGGGQGTGHGNQAGSSPSGSGGGYGGYGGLSSSNATGGLACGSPFAPAQLGSGGGSGNGGIGAAGGGSIRLIIGGRFLLNGNVKASGSNATNSRSGGGSGGSIWATAQTFSGTGTLAANGGTGEPIHGGGGGGGRIALEFVTNNFVGTLSAIGGSGWQWGGAGTLFLRTSGTTGAVTFDNGGHSGAATLLQFTNAADLTIQGSAIAAAASSSRQTIRDLLVRSNSAIVTTTTNNATLQITVQGDAFLEQGANIPLNGRGAPATVPASDLPPVDRN